MKSLLIPVLALALPVTPPAAGATVKETRAAMGSPFEVTAVHADAAVARTAVERAYAEIERIEAFLSSWRETSETSAVNRAAGHGPVRVSQELFNLLRRSLRVSKLTGGAFDPTFAAAGALWDFQAATPRLPEAGALARALELVDYRRVRLDPEAVTVELPRPGMRIGFGGIGKGYAANRAVLVMQETGVAGALVNAGGDVVAYGHQDGGAPWRVGIADPLVAGRIFAYLEVTDQAVVTSGDYERFVVIDGERYAHILDPRTGWPVRGVRSVTVVCPDGELADALATAVFVLGVEEGLRLAEALHGVEALVVDGEGRIHYSSNLKARLLPAGSENPLE